MRVILFGASGMVGQGVLRECLLDPDVTSAVSIVRSGTGQQHAKLREIVHRDFLDFSFIEAELSGLDACFFCLGISSAGMSEEKYRRVTYDIAVTAAQTLVKLNPNMTMVFVSGAGTDSSERGRVMWARVKGQTENALLRLPFKAAYMFRPGVIVPLHGIKSRTMLYRIPYLVLAPILPLLNRLFPKYVTTTEKLGRAILTAAKRGAPKKVLECADINELSSRATLPRS
jgi:uncharacterized protein YbjT (DUF2867 family)